METKSFLYICTGFRECSSSITLHTSTCESGLESRSILAKTRAWAHTLVVMLVDRYLTGVHHSRLPPSSSLLHRLAAYENVMAAISDSLTSTHLLSSHHGRLFGGWSAGWKKTGWGERLFYFLMRDIDTLVLMGIMHACFRAEK